MESLKLPKGEISKILAALKNGEISLNDLINGGNGRYGINRGNRNNSEGIDGNGTKIPKDMIVLVLIVK